MTLQEMLSEAKNVNLAGYGFKKQTKPVIDGHCSYIKSLKDMILTDAPGNEWHHVVDGVVVKVGKLSDNSLKKLLNGD
jgi:hypothetical protein